MPSQPMKTGDVVLSVEVMKMATALHSPSDGVAKELLMHAVNSMDAKDLLVVLEE